MFYQSLRKFQIAYKMRGDSEEHLITDIPLETWRVAERLSNGKSALSLISSGQLTLDHYTAMLSHLLGPGPNNTPERLIKDLDYIDIVITGLPDEEDDDDVDPTKGADA